MQDQSLQLTIAQVEDLRYVADLIVHEAQVLQIRQRIRHVQYLSDFVVAQVQSLQTESHMGVPFQQCDVPESLEVVITDVDVLKEVLPQSSANTSVAPRFSMAEIFLAMDNH